MSHEIYTEHRIEDGQQVTDRVVYLYDAVGDVSRHRFRVTDDGYQYLNDGEPTEAATRALEAFDEEREVAA